MAPCTGPAEAQALQQRLLARLQAMLSATPHTPAALGTPTPVPTRSGWVECTFELPLAAFDTLVAAVDSGWWHGGDEIDRSSVWNAGTGAPLLDPAVTWAEVLTAPRPRG